MGNFVHHHCGCTLTYPPLTYPKRSQGKILIYVQIHFVELPFQLVLNIFHETNMVSCRGMLIMLERINVSLCSFKRTKLILSIRSAATISQQYTYKSNRLKLNVKLYLENDPTDYFKISDNLVAGFRKDNVIFKEGLTNIAEWTSPTVLPSFF